MRPRALFVLAMMLGVLLVVLLSRWLDDGKKSQQPVLDLPAATTKSYTGEKPLERADSAGNRVAGKATAHAPEPAAIALHQAPETEFDAATHKRRIVGTITSAADGRGIFGCWVSGSLDGAGMVWTDPFETTSDAHGNFEQANLGPGTWKLSCRREGYIPLDHVLLVPDGEGEVHADFELVPEASVSNVTVRLRTPDGKPLFDTLTGQDREAALNLRPLFVETCPRKGLEMPPNASVLRMKAKEVIAPGSDAWFQVTLELVTPGCACLMLGDRVLDAMPFDPRTKDVVLVVAFDDVRRWLGSLHLVLVEDRTGKPVQDARVSVRPTVGPTRTVSTDDKGVALIHLLMTGKAVLEIEASGFASVVQPVIIRAGDETDAGTVRLISSVSISGRVDLPPPSADPLMAARPVVFVFSTREDGQVSSPVAVASAPGSSGMPNATVQVDEHGAFMFPGLSPGSYVLGWHYRGPPSAELVQKGAIPGWVYADARYGDVSGLHLVVTEEMWKAANEAASRRR